MSERQMKKRRYNRKLEYIAEFDQWMRSEPPVWHFMKWRKWKNERPVFRG